MVGLETREDGIYGGGRGGLERGYNSRSGIAFEKMVSTWELLCFSAVICLSCDVESCVGYVLISILAYLSLL